MPRCAETAGQSKREKPKNLRPLCAFAWHDHRGVAALEFALIAFPLLLMLFGILQVGFYLKSRNDLDLATDAAARQIMVGGVQSQYAALTADQFKAAYLCPNLPSTFSCDQVVVNATMFDEADTAGAGFYTFVGGSPPALRISTSEQSFCLGNGGNYVYLQVAYPLSALSSAFGAAALLSRLSTSGWLASSAAFKNEPFSDSQYILPTSCTS
ncbi:TadE-like protein [mine drainage metagenome]|uniref:TadE-like protein n=1 Tax=mine drainage metagenome TaxID=410659 RepID=A0A1J5RLB7_9ZZZZ